MRGWSRVVFILVLALRGSAGADALPVGGEFRVNTATASFQGFPSACRSSAGDIVAVWINALGVSGQRYDATGGPVGGEFQLHTNPTSLKQAPAVRCADGLGAGVVVWEGREEGRTDFDIVGRRYDKVPVGVEFQVNVYTTGQQTASAVCGDATGGFVTLWQSEGQDGSSHGIFGRRFDGAGGVLGAEFQVNVHTTSSQSSPTVCCHPTGGFVVVWQSLAQDGDGYGLVGRRYDDGGAPVGGEFLVNSHTALSQGDPSVCCDDAGNFVVVWGSESQDGDGDGVFSRRFDSTGTTLGDEFRVNTYTTGAQRNPAVGCAASGDFVVVWESSEEVPGGQFEIFGRRFSSAAVPDGPAFQVNTYTTAGQLNASIAADVTGDFVVVWESERQDGSGYGVYGQLFTGVCGSPADCDDGDACTVDLCEPTDEAADALGCVHVDVVCVPLDECHLAGVCNPGTGTCANPAKGDGSPCPDADLCNGDETCQGGACTPGSPLDCDDANACTTDTCDASLGCENTAVADGTPCADADLCNGDESCQGGACAAGTALNCDDGNRCTTDTCDPSLGCQNTAVVNGTPCPDADLCNGDETCQGGTCSPGTPLDCDDANACTTDTCDAGLGCENTAVANGTPCADADLCNGDETCQGGACAAGTALNCDDGNRCTTDTCDPSLGCQNTAVVNGTPCPDADLCNGDETCQGGACAAGTALNCDDGNRCTTDTCDLSLGCQNTAVAEGTPCPDADLCNGDESCQGGACTPGTPLDCDDANACTTDTCEAALGCQNTAVAEGTPCPDADLCNGDETCRGGACTAGTPLDCDDGDVCTTDTCEPALGCENTVVADGTPCPDADLCNGDESCQGGACTPGTPLDCDDANACTTDTCEAALGCENTVVADGTPCPDADLCNGDESCQGGACTPGTPLDCDDANVCTTDTCDPDLGCQNIPVADDTPCADADLCNGDETCRGGACTPGTPLDCDDANVCTTDTCDPDLGCQNIPVADDTPCPDADLCNGDESCQGGACTPGSPLDCDDGDACTTDSCSPISGCINTPIPDCTSCTFNADCTDGNPCTSDLCAAGTCRNASEPDGTPCPDGNVCNGEETCQAGACTPGAPLNCADGDLCTDDACDAGSGCVHTPNTAPCDDGDACTADDTCAGGACKGTAKDCSDLDGPCETGVCEAETGACRAESAEDGATCDDGDPCTEKDTCQGGVCRGDPMICRPAGQCYEVGTCRGGVCDAPLKPNGIPCGSACMTGGTCQNGRCIGATEAVVCTPLDDCHDAGECNVLTGRCTNPPKSDGAPCDDGDACTQGDSCRSGACMPGSPSVCQSQDQCHAPGVCDPATGVCSNPPKPDGARCDDGDPCTSPDQCMGGSCGGALVAFSAAQCKLVRLGQVEELCAGDEIPNAVAKVLRRKGKRAAKTLDKVEREMAANKVGKMKKHLRRFDKLVAAMQKKVDAFVSKGALSDTCGASVGDITAELAGFAEHVRS